MRQNRQPGSAHERGLEREGSHEAARRPENRRLRELVDEMLATIRCAAGRDLWTPDERSRSIAELDLMLGDTMQRLRREVMEPGSPADVPAARVWRAPKPTFTRTAFRAGERERQVRSRLRLRQGIDALLDAIRGAANPERGSRLQWDTDVERATYERQLERIMASVRAEAVGRGPT